ncbi:Fatty acid desaturase (ISS) [Dorcoceras hygrometricum]|uniref:Fatty acid desaturase (ISS) n=1 Tax=Dorcoceras hygrometricum TaxID=472368 RepID=A0A2Z7CC33_9LAMI|nr:Fatty acid desaturase (ISS) [Dorcoceras hygrometricum]
MPEIIKKRISLIIPTFKNLMKRDYELGFLLEVLGWNSDFSGPLIVVIVRGIKTQKTQKQEKKYEVKTQYEEPSKNNFLSTTEFIPTADFLCLCWMLSETIFEGSNSKKQSRGYTVPISILLTTLVQADLRESVKLHSKKVLTSRSVQAYIRKNQDIIPEGEPSMREEDTARNPETSLPHQEKSAETESLVVVQETGVNISKKRKHKDGGKKKRTKKATKMTTQTAEKQTVEESRPVAPTHFDSEEISEPDSCLLVTRRCRREQVSESLDSESTISLPLKYFVKNRRNQRQRTQMGWTAAKISSQPDPTPVSPTEQERTVDDQMEQGSGGDRFATGLEFDAREEHEEQQDQEITAADRECIHSDSIPNAPVGGEGNLDDELLNIGSNAPEKTASEHDARMENDNQMANQGCETHMDSENPTAKVSGVIPNEPVAIEKYFQLLFTCAWNTVSTRMTMFVEWLHFRQECIRRLHKELRAIAAIHKDHRVLAGPSSINQDPSEKLPALEFSHLVDHEQGAAQATRLQLHQPGHETPAMTSHEHQAQENEPAIQTDERQNVENEHQALDEFLQGSTQALADRPAVFVSSAQHDSDHQGPDPSNLQLIASASLHNHANPTAKSILRSYTSTQALTTKNRAQTTRNAHPKAQKKQRQNLLNETSNSRTSRAYGISQLASKLVSMGRASLKESSATKNVKNRGWNRRKMVIEKDDARHTQALLSAAGHSYLIQLLNPLVNTQNVDQHVSLPQSFSRQKQYRPAATLRNKLKPADATRHAYFTLPMQTPAVDGLDIKIDVLERTLTQRMVNELDVVKSQLAALLEGMKEFGAAKKGEGVQNRRGEVSSGDGGPSNVRGRGLSLRGGRGSSSGGGRGQNQRTDDPCDSRNNLDICHGSKS